MGLVTQSARLLIGGGGLILTAGDSKTSAALGSGWLITVVFGIPTAFFGFLAYRAQRARDERSADIEADREEKEREAARKAAEAAEAAAANERMRMVLDGQREQLDAANIEVSRMHALEIDMHARNAEQQRELDSARRALRECEDDRARMGRELVRAQDDLARLRAANGGTSP